MQNTDRPLGGDQRTNGTDMDLGCEGQETDACSVHASRSKTFQPKSQVYGQERRVNMSGNEPSPSVRQYIQEKKM